MFGVSLCAFTKAPHTLMHIIYGIHTFIVRYIYISYIYITVLVSGMEHKTHKTYINCLLQQQTDWSQRRRRTWAASVTVGWPCCWGGFVGLGLQEHRAQRVAPQNQTKKCRNQPQHTTATVMWLQRNVKGRREERGSLSLCVWYLCSVYQHHQHHLQCCDQCSAALPDDDRSCRCLILSHTNAKHVHKHTQKMQYGRCCTNSPRLDRHSQQRANMVPVVIRRRKKHPLT